MNCLLMKIKKFISQKKKKRIKKWISVDHIDSSRYSNYNFFPNKPR